LNFRGRINTVLHHDKPDQVPFGIHADLFPRGYFERELRNLGVGLVEMGRGTRLESAIWSEMPNVTVETRTKGNIVTAVFHTPVGHVSTKYWSHMPRMDMPPIEYLFKDTADYDVLNYLLEDTVFHREDRNYFDTIRDLGDDGIMVESGISIPYETLAYEFMGLEKWSIEQYKNPHDFRKLLEATEKRVEKALPYVASSPGKIVSCGGFAGYYGPEKLEKYVLPFYKKFLPLLHNKGKICINHAHASNLKCIKDLIPQTGLDAIEAFTPPPVGDLSLKEALDAWGDKIAIWVNLPESIFSLGVEETKKYVSNLADSAQGFGWAIVCSEIALVGVKDEVTRRFLQEGFRVAAETINKFGKYPISSK
jgi:hypothetical protein